MTDKINISIHGAASVSAEIDEQRLKEMTREQRLEWAREQFEKPVKVHHPSSITYKGVDYQL